MDKREGPFFKTPIPTTSETQLREIGADPASRRWREFERAYRPMMEGFLAKKFPGVEAEDVVQETLASLAQALPEYVYEPAEKGPFHCYLTGILKNKATDALEAKSKRERRDVAYARGRLDAGEVMQGTEDGIGEGEGREPALAVPGDAPGATREEWEQAVVSIAVGELRRERKEDRQWQAFWRTWLGEESMEAVAESLGMSRDAVYKARERMMARLREIVGRLEEW